MKDEKRERPEAYPKPSVSDNQYKEQDEFTERQGNRRTPQPGNDPHQDIDEKRRNAENQTLGNP